MSEVVDKFSSAIIDGQRGGIFLIGVVGVSCPIR